MHVQIWQQKFMHFSHKAVLNTHNLRGCANIWVLPSNRVWQSCQYQVSKTATYAFRSRERSRKNRDPCLQVSRPRPRPVTDELESARDSRPWSRDHM